MKELKVYDRKPTVKNLSHVKMAKHECWLNDASLIVNDKIESICVMEQGIDLVKDKLNKTEDEKEYAIIKVYLK